MRRRIGRGAGEIHRIARKEGERRKAEGEVRTFRPSPFALRPLLPVLIFLLALGEWGESSAAARTVRPKGRKAAQSVKEQRRKAKRTVGGRSASGRRRTVRRWGASGPTRRTPQRDDGPITARAAVALDMQTDEMVFGKNPNEQLPIASLTKMMTAVVFLEGQPDLGQEVVVAPEDVENASRTRFRPGERVTLNDLLHASLIRSDNGATRTLARTSAGTMEEFVWRMNRKAQLLGLEHTFFVEPTGLDPRDVSTAFDCARLIRAVVRDSLISRIMSMKEYSFKTNRIVHRIANTNRLLRSPLRIFGGKTGYTRPAGYCLATCARDERGREIAMVILRARSSRRRFEEARRVIGWAMR